MALMVTHRKRHTEYVATDRWRDASKSDPRRWSSAIRRWRPHLSSSAQSQDPPSRKAAPPTPTNVRPKPARQRPPSASADDPRMSSSAQSQDPPSRKAAPPTPTKARPKPARQRPSSASADDPRMSSCAQSQDPPSPKPVDERMRALAHRKLVQPDYAVPSGLSQRAPGNFAATVASTSSIDARFGMTVPTTPGSPGRSLLTM